MQPFAISLLSCNRDLLALPWDQQYKEYMAPLRHNVV